MSKSSGAAVIAADLTVTGEIRNGGHVAVLGLVEGTLAARHVSVQPGGRILGSLVAETADIDGKVEGQVLVRQLLKIGASGSVQGGVRYGRIAMEPGGELSADLKNVPPDIAGDLNLVVKRGESVAIATEDLTAIDPDSPAGSLMFAVTSPVNGFVARASARASPIDRFTQLELERKAVVFVHDGSRGAAASFDVTVTDNAGASSGKARTVQVAVFP
jgi:cytoskeletal protein CcmA (bactofilin family)